MASRRNGLKPDVQLDSHFSHDERERDGFDVDGDYCGGAVMGSADHPYGHVDGFRETMHDTGWRNKETALGRKARGR